MATRIGFSQDCLKSFTDYFLHLRIGRSFCCATRKPVEIIARVNSTIEVFIFDLIKLENLQQALLSHSFVGIEDIVDVEVDIDVIVGVEGNVVVVGGDSQTSLLNISPGAKFLAKQNFPLSFENTGEFGRHTCKCTPYLHFCQKK